MVASKPEGVRARRNKASTRTTLQPVKNPGTVKVPPLPSDRPWHKRTIEHWDAVWQTPMAPEFDLDADYRALVMLAEMWDDYYTLGDDTELSLDKKARLRTNLMGLILRNEQRFGLTPLDRRRLQWEIDRGEEAEAKTRKRKNERVARAPDPAEVDPRALLGP